MLPAALLRQSAQVLLTLRVQCTFTSLEHLWTVFFMAQTQACLLLHIKLPVLSSPLPSAKHTTYTLSPKTSQCIKCFWTTDYFIGWPCMCLKHHRLKKIWPTTYHLLLWLFHIYKMRFYCRCAFSSAPYTLLRNTAKRHFWGKCH